MKLSTKLFLFASLFTAIAAQELSAGCPGGVCGKQRITMTKRKKAKAKKISGFPCANGQCNLR